jgi:Zn finger protein HypA/HybF involved in hydrogenase expression
MNKKYTYEFVKIFLLNKKIKLLSQIYNNCKEKLNLKCLECGYEWYVRFDGLKNGNSGCPRCSWIQKVDNSTFKYDFVENCLLNRNIKLLSLQYNNTDEKLKLECLKCNHIWFATFYSIKNRNTGCPKCAKCLKHTYEYVKEFLFSRNIKLLSKEYKNITQKLKYECLKCQHVWSTNFNNIHSKNSGCPCCNFPGINQKKIYNIIKEIFPIYEVCFNCRDFNWLRNKKKMEIDIFVKEIKLAIEYDGRQHYNRNSIFLKNNDFDETNQRDNLKNNLIKEHPEEVKYFIRIPYWEKITEENIRKILTEQGILH